MVVHHIQLELVEVVATVDLVVLVLVALEVLVVLDLHIIFLELLFSMPVVVAVEQEPVDLVEQVVPVLVAMVELLEMAITPYKALDLEEVVVDIKHHQLFQVVEDLVALVLSSSLIPLDKYQKDCYGSK
tara:strand:- start:158 stop:544 length:387 start_codon:yes stop_codon:yes gene_type:complete